MWLIGKESTRQCRRCGFNSWFGEIPWRRKRHPTPVLFPGKSHRQRNSAGYSPWGPQRVGHDLETKQQQAAVEGVQVACRPLSSLDDEGDERDKGTDEEECFSFFLSEIIFRRRVWWLKALVYCFPLK